MPSAMINAITNKIDSDLRSADLPADVDCLLSLLAAELDEKNDKPNRELLASVRASLATICHSIADLGAVRSDPVGLERLADSNPTSSCGHPRAEALISALNGTTDGAALLTPHGVIQHANAAFIALASVDLHSPTGCSLEDALQFEIDSFPEILTRVASGIPWSGKASARADSERSYWISLSCSNLSAPPQNVIIALVSDISEVADTEKRLRRQAMHDKLTGLPNRRYFCDHLDEMLARMREQGSGADICFLDLDDFKHVNDCTGHANGDLLLRAIGDLIRVSLGPNAFISRFGGDEFAVVLPDSPERVAGSIEPYEALLRTFREPIPLIEAEALISASIGVTRFPEHGTDIDVLLANADAAMYAAKAAGKNQARMYSTTMQADRLARQQVQSKLRKALNDGEIELWFQPKVDAKTGSPVGCEALARWRTPNGDYIPPGRFVPVAEQTGLIYPLGNKVFQLAAETACRWNRDGIAPNIAVNVSPQQLRHPRFIQQLRCILEETQAQASWFELEITENAVMDDVEHAVACIDELGSIGFRIAIDDFGTGYSSLSYLKTFNIHTLKIDLSFVRDLMRDDQSNAIVRTIISLGSGLGLKLVAEGVETSQQAEFLTEAGCDILQGYLFGKPSPAGEYVQWLKKHDVN